VTTKARALQDTRAPVKMDDHLRGKDAAGGSFDPGQQQ
jgi:hypothetical protein